MADSTGKPKCASCGQFIGGGNIGRSRCEFTPLNEFGPEEIEWTCPSCMAAEPQLVCRG